jgi:L-threonylcarbamoyladenylate synthase
MMVVPPEQVEQAARALDSGQMVAVYTQRWYMLCGNASNRELCARMLALKRRPADKPLLLALDSPETARERFVLSPAAELLATAFWPGELTLRLPWRRAGGQQAGGPGNALACRPGGVFGQLAKQARQPVAATSLNISGPVTAGGTRPAITLAEVRAFSELTGARIAVAVDGGVSPCPVDTTIVDCTAPQPRLERRGFVHERALAAVMGSALPSSDQEPAAPPR